MKRIGAFSLASACLLASCSHSVVSNRNVKIPAHQTTAVREMIRRQAANADDAGEGSVWLRMLRQRVTAEPKNVDVRMELASHYERTGAAELAVEHYRAAVELDRGRVDAVVSLARVLRKLQFPGEARKALDFFESAHPGESSRVLTWLATLDDEEGKLKDAEQRYRQAVALEPKSDSLHNNLGYNLLLQGRKDEAAAEFRQALSLNPKSVIARNNLGAALAARPQEAVAQWQAVSDPATAHNNLAALMMEQGNYADARRELSIALGYRRDHAAVIRNLQLLSELEGTPVTLDRIHSPGNWQRFVSVFKRVVVGIEEPKAAAPVQTARE